MTGRKQTSISWNPAEHILLRGSDVLGLLLSPDCSRLELYHNRQLALTYDLVNSVESQAGDDKLPQEDIAKAFLDPEKKLFGVIDIYGGPQRVRLYPESVEPTDTMEGTDVELNM